MLPEIKVLTLIEIIMILSRLMDNKNIFKREREYLYLKIKYNKNVASTTAWPLLLFTI